MNQAPKKSWADVRIVTVPEARRAAIRFSGYATDASIAEQQGLLLGWLQSRKLGPVGAPTYAYYNDPFTPGPLRRNEVIYDVAEE